MTPTLLSLALALPVALVVCGLPPLLRPVWCVWRQMLTLSYRCTCGWCP